MVYFRQIRNLNDDISYTVPPFAGIPLTEVPGIDLPDGTSRIGSAHFVIIADASADNVVISLPESNDSIKTYVGIQYTIIKIDDSINTVSIVPSNNDKIDSSVSPIVISNQFDRISILSIGGSVDDGNWLTM